LGAKKVSISFSIIEDKAMNQAGCFEGTQALPHGVKACLQAKEAKQPSQSRIKSIKDLKEAFFAPTICLQCGDPSCVTVCPSKTLAKNPETGIVEWSKDKCVNCLLCTLACPYGGIVYDSIEEHVIKCDHCGGDPACVKACEKKALVYRTENEIFNKVGDLEDIFLANSCCVGCNIEIVIRHILRRIGPNTIVAAPPGCVPGVGTVGVNGLTCTKVPSFHLLLTNTASMLAGIKRYYKRIGRDVTMLALAGDGGTADVEFQSLSGAAERGEQMIFVCLDNEGYMNTGMQRSGTTPFGSWTSTTPVGAELRGKKVTKNIFLLSWLCISVSTLPLFQLLTWTIFITSWIKLSRLRKEAWPTFMYSHLVLLVGDLIPLKQFRFNGWQ